MMEHGSPGLSRGRVRFADEKAVGAREPGEHGAVLHRRGVATGMPSGPGASVARR